MKKILFSVTFLLFSLCGLWAQNVSNVTCHQEGQSIIVEYDIDKAADGVKLYVSIDGGYSFKGPLREVEGDIYKVSRGRKRIIWNVLNEFESFTGNNIVFKVVPRAKSKGSTKFHFCVGANYGSTTNFDSGSAKRSFTNGIWDVGVDLGFRSKLTHQFGLEASVSTGGATTDSPEPYCSGGTIVEAEAYYRWFPGGRHFYLGPAAGYAFSPSGKTGTAIADLQIGLQFGWLILGVYVGYPQTGVTVKLDLCSLFQ